MAKQPTPTEEPERSFEEIADAVVELSKIGKAIESSRMKQRTVILLLHHKTKVSKTDIAYVLNALPDLERHYLK